MVIYIQSCVRRRLARKELKALKAEARSVSKFKEISYKLENKVVELTQTLQTRTAEKKDLQTKLVDLQQQLNSWVTKHEETDTRVKHLQSELHSAQAEIAQRDALLQSKKDVELRLEDALVKVTEKEDAIQKLMDDLGRQAQELSQRHRNAEMSQSRIDEDGSIVATLKNEVSNLREQLNRANALNALTRGGRAEPVSPTFVPALRSENGLPTGTTLAPPPGKRHQRRHSSAGGFGADPDGAVRDTSDDLMVSVKRNQLRDPRSVSMAYSGQDNLSRFRTNGLTDIYDDPAEEKLKLLEDAKHLDEDVLDGLIRGLKIPAPSSQNTLAAKEILFPANLISLTTNEMWKYGLIAESERFLANVMQAIQAHVMVRSRRARCGRNLTCLTVFLRRRCHHSWSLLVV
jgi:myosin V